MNNRDVPAPLCYNAAHRFHSQRHRDRYIVSNPTRLCVASNKYVLWTAR